VFSNVLYARIYIPAASASWLVVEIVTFGEDRLLQASLDAAYFLVFAFAVIGLVGVVRQAAARVDSANTEAIQSAIANAKVEAFEKERQKIDALVHDQVLHSLLVAARASSPSEEKSAQLSAENAMRSLALASKNVTQTEFVTSSALISAIALAAKSLDYSRVQVEVPVDSTFNVPSEVAKGITEATIQALDNAIQHSMAKEITLRMLADFNSQLTVIIEDDGLGFRVDRIPRDRIGIKTSIQFRLTSIGGAAEITSKPGEGTLVKLVWPID
jgi:signal transduction histidine kinase